MPIIHYDIAAALMAATTLYLFYGRKKVKDRASAYFEGLLWAILGLAISSAASSLVVASPERFPLAARYAAQLAFYFFNNGMPVFLAAYLATIAGGLFPSRPRRVRASLFFLPAAFIVILIVANPFLGLLFRFDGAGSYVRGPLIGLPYLAAAFYMAYIAVLLISKRKRFAKNYPIFVVAAALPILASACESAFPELVCVEDFAAACSAMLLVFTIQNSDSLVDGTTGLFNRAAFVKFAEARIRSPGGVDALLVGVQNVALLRQLYDIEDFLGAIKAMASYLSSLGRREASAFYLGNESFAVLLGREFGDQERRRIAERARARFGQSWESGQAQLEIPVEMCLVRCPAEASSAIEILRSLECLVSLDARHSGRKILSAADLDLVDGRRESRVEAAIRSTIDSRRMTLLYEPVFSVSERRFALADATMSLCLDDDGPIGQAELLRVAEPKGLARKMGELALERICDFYKKGGLEAKLISQVQLRLSAAHCMQGDLHRQLSSIARSRGVLAERVCIEITESVASRSTSVMDQNLRALKSQSFDLAIGDYGTGYTDLGRLVELPFSFIKLDRGIIGAGFESEKGRIILEGTIAMIKRLNRRIIATGVETEAQADSLARMGCDYLQGRLFSAPLSEEKFLAILA